MAKSQDAAKFMSEGRGNCAQAVLYAFAGELGLEPDAAFRLAQGFGAGTARTDGVCGAINAAIIVIGLKIPASSEYAVRRERVYSSVQDFVRTFKARHGSVGCSSLLGCNLSTPEGKSKARESGVCDRVCPEMVASAVEILDELFPKAAL